MSRSGIAANGAAAAAVRRTPSSRRVRLLPPSGSTLTETTFKHSLLPPPSTLDLKLLRSCHHPHLTLTRANCVHNYRWRSDGLWASNGTSSTGHSQRGATPFAWWCGRALSSTSQLVARGGMQQAQDCVGLRSLGGATWRRPLVAACCLVAAVHHRLDEPLMALSATAKQSAPRHSPSSRSIIDRPTCRYRQRCATRHLRTSATSATSAWPYVCNATATSCSRDTCTRGATSRDAVGDTQRAPSFSSRADAPTDIRPWPDDACLSPGPLRQLLGEQALVSRQLALRRRTELVELPRPLPILPTTRARPAPRPASPQPPAPDTPAHTTETKHRCYRPDKRRAPPPPSRPSSPPAAAAPPPQPPHVGLRQPTRFPLRPDGRVS